MEEHKCEFIFKIGEGEVCKTCNKKREEIFIKPIPSPYAQYLFSRHCRPMVILKPLEVAGQVPNHLIELVAKETGSKGIVIFTFDKPINRLEDIRNFHIAGLNVLPDLGLVIRHLLEVLNPKNGK